MVKNKSGLVNPQFFSLENRGMTAKSPRHFLQTGFWEKRFGNVSILAILVFFALSSLAGAQTVVSNKRLSLQSVMACGPRVALAPNGDCTVVWRQTLALPSISGAIQAVEEIVVRRRRDSVWEDAQVLTRTDGLIELGEPSIALGPKGRATVVWVADGPKTSTLEFTYEYTRAGGAIVQWAPVQKVESAMRVESPSVFILPHGDSVHTFFTWEERLGSSDRRIQALVIDAVGNEHASILAGEESLTYVTLPELFALGPEFPEDGPRMAVCWYNVEESQVALDMRVWDPAEARWRALDTPDWDPLALYSLPLVTATAEEGPLLVGYTANKGTNQIFLSSGNRPLAFLLSNGLSQNKNPCLSLPWGEQVGLVWLRDTASGMNLVPAVLRPAGQFATLPEIPVDSFLPAEPDVAVNQDHLLAVWVAPTPARSDGTNALIGNRIQTPAVFFSEYALDDPLWRPIVETEEN